MKKLTVIMLVLAVVFGSAFAKGAAEAAQSQTTTTPAATAEVEVKPATYTYNGAASVFPTNWNPHTYETATDSDLLGYLQAGFYTFDYN